jgi:hypothetical protein
VNKYRTSHKIYFETNALTYTIRIEDQKKIVQLEESLATLTELVGELKMIVRNTSYREKNFKKVSFFR